MLPKLTFVEQELGASLPHRRMEAWKWTDVRARETVPKSGLTSAMTLDIDLPDGLSLRRADEPAKDHPMGKIARNFCGKAYMIDVPAGFQSAKPLKLNGLGQGHGRIFVKIGAGAKLEVWENHESTTPDFVNLEISFDLGEAAELTRTLIHTDHADTTRIITAYINAWGGAKIRQYALSFGAGIARLETNIAALGEGVSAEINGAYLLSGKRHTDMTSLIDLTGENAHIRQCVKGVVSDKARGVFQGKFHVRRPAQFTDAQMRHDALMLSDTSEIRAKPELEIYADDVACAHGNTLGALDESALFYMRTRGIAAPQARALLTQAFVAEAFEGMADNTEFTARIEAWLEQHA